MVAISCIVSCATGCDSFNSLEADLTGKADSTLRFWAELQGIQWHGNREISGLNEANSVASRAHDVEGVASGFSMLSEKHSQLAAKLSALHENTVDESAIVYRDRLVTAHQALCEEYKEHAAAANDRDSHRLEQGRPELKSLLTEYTRLCNEKNTVISTLQKRYNCSFDVAE